MKPFKKLSEKIKQKNRGLRTTGKYGKVKGKTKPKSL
jgi:hypothetical protein